MDLSPPKARQKKIFNADIVFCIDGRGGMQDSLAGIKNNINDFARELESQGAVDFRFALIVFRDRHDSATNPESEWKLPTNKEPWFYSPDFVSNIGSNAGKPVPEKIGFTGDTSAFRSWLEHPACEAYGGGSEGMDSALDAIYDALNRADWRENRTHRSIVLITDQDAYPTLAKDTYKRPDNGVNRICQDIATNMKHGIIFLCAPRCNVYEDIEKMARKANRKVVYRPVSKGERLRGINFKNLLQLIASDVSNSAPSIRIDRDDVQ